MLEFDRRELLNSRCFIEMCKEKDSNRETIGPRQV
jgi:hypothetical protein